MPMYYRQIAVLPFAYVHTYTVTISCYGSGYCAGIPYSRAGLSLQVPLDVSSSLYILTTK